MHLIDFLVNPYFISSTIIRVCRSSDQKLIFYGPICAVPDDFFGCRVVCFDDFDDPEVSTFSIEV